MKKSSIHYSIILPFGLLIFLFAFFQWNASDVDNMSSSLMEDHASQAQDVLLREEKHKGAHVFGIVDTTDFQPLIQSNLEWVTMVSWGFQTDFDSPDVSHHDGDILHIEQHNAHWVKQIELVRSAGFKVFFKPHLWINSPSDGKWRADIFPKNEENWKLWKEAYRGFIIRYAKVAEQANAEVYCIGTEFSRLSLEKPLFWKKLIQEIRAVYSGKITYAANWYDEYEKISFWDQLDFIGIQAYFPLSTNKYPSVAELAKGWGKYLSALESIQKKYNRKILFTEMGYKSTANSAIEPWEWAEDSSAQNNLFSEETQANCYKAFFNTVWDKEWFAGVHIWQIRTDYKKKRDKNNLDFTPQGKLAENVITKGFE